MKPATDPGYTLYGLHRRRGKEGIIDLGVMDQRQGVAVHDFWKPYYYSFGSRHALCNALLRDLTGLYEVTGDAWVTKLRSLLAVMLEATNQARRRGIPRSTQPGRVKRHLAQNLLRRLENASV